MFFIGWLGSAVLSRKRIQNIREKDGTTGVVMAWSFLGLLISLALAIGSIIIVESTRGGYTLLDITSTLFFVMCGVCALEVIVIMVKR